MTDTEQTEPTLAADRGSARTVGLSRRGLLRGALAGGAALTAVAATTTVSEILGAPFAQAATDPVYHLVSRATYGPTWALVDEVRRVGVDAWLAAQLDLYSRVPDTAMDTLLTRWPRLMRTWDVHDANAGWDVMYDLLGTHTARAIWSERQVLEVMVDFWSNHLNVTCPSSEVWDSRHLYDRDVIRKHALGTFTNLLVASAKHRAMLS